MENSLEKKQRVNLVDGLLWRFIDRKATKCI